MDFWERFYRIMNYQNPGKIPVSFFGTWPETKVRWHGEGLDFDLGACGGTSSGPQISGMDPDWEHGMWQSRGLIDYYLRNATLIREEMTALGYDCVGGKNSPYIWIDCQSDSWEFFDLLLKKAGVVCTPGAGFGKCGEGYVRISAFNNIENVQKAMSRISSILK